MSDVIGIVGSRRRASDYDYQTLIRQFKKIYQPGDWIVSGGCKQGADKFAEEIAYNKCIPIIIYNAEWEQYGKQAGIIRNSDIAQHCTILIALPASDRKGGTEDTIKKVRGLGKEIILI